MVKNLRVDRRAAGDLPWVVCGKPLMHTMPNFKFGWHLDALAWNLLPRVGSGWHLVGGNVGCCDYVLSVLR